MTHTDAARASRHVQSQAEVGAIAGCCSTMLPLRWLVTFRKGTELSVDKAAELLEAARAGDEARMRALLPPAGIAEEDGLRGEADGMTPLMAAAAGGHE